mmetsp:Transcript_31843/g.44556  ORF Transcript_31843/g.44556 Transcript_31843/m.44556 type:complete len:226 (+) Transcript_31843:80-757(+)
MEGKEITSAPDMLTKQHSLPQDPSFADGYRVVYDRKVGIEVRAGAEPKQGVGDMKTFKIRILLLGSNENPDSIRMELSTEDDLFFNYFHTLDGSGFDHMKNRQKLMIQFQSYPMVLMSTLNKCIKQPHTYMCVLYISENGTGRLDFIQNMEYKFVDLLSVRFTKSTEEFIRQQVSYRYKMMKKQVSMLQHKLEEVNKMIKLRNPSLLLQVGKILPKPIINDWESR